MAEGGAKDTSPESKFFHFHAVFSKILENTKLALSDCTIISIDRPIILKNHENKKSQSSHDGTGNNWIFRFEAINYVCQLSFPIYSMFLPYLQTVVLANMELDNSGYKRIIFQGYKIHWSPLTIMAQLRRNWQYWHSCIVEIWWESIFPGQFTRKE